MFALVDVTSMYASVEKIYNPNLRNKPVMVLSNNDGCVVAACPIAKRLGFKKFVPYFQVKEEAKKQGLLFARLTMSFMPMCLQKCFLSCLNSVMNCTNTVLMKLSCAFRHAYMIVNGWP